MSTRNTVLTALAGTAAGLLLMFGVAAIASANPPSVEISAVDAGVADPSMAVETHLDGNGPVVAAPADAPPKIIDADSEPVAAAKQVYSFWKSGALVPAVILGLFGLAVIASRRIPWLTEGKRAVWVASGLTGLAILAEPASRGVTPSWGVLLTAVGAIAALLIQPTPKSKTADA